jgi:hypothetical protein
MYFIASLGAGFGGTRIAEMGIHSMKKGKSELGKPELLTMAPPALTEFEQTVRRLNLKPYQYVASKELKD